MLASAFAALYLTVTTALATAAPSKTILNRFTLEDYPNAICNARRDSTEPFLDSLDGLDFHPCTSTCPHDNIIAKGVTSSQFALPFHDRTAPAPWATR